MGVLELTPINFFPWVSEVARAVPERTGRQGWFSETDKIQNSLNGQIRFSKIQTSCLDF